MEQETDTVISQFKASSDDALLARLVDRIRGEKDWDSPQRMELLVQVFAVVDDYLRRHPKPERTPWLNIRPPDGGTSGIDPKEVKNPTARAQYERAIADNGKLLEAHRKHRALTDVRERIVRFCKAFKSAKPENKALLRQILLDQKVEATSSDEIVNKGN